MVRTLCVKDFHWKLVKSVAASPQNGIQILLYNIRALLRIFSVLLVVNTDVMMVMMMMTIDDDDRFPNIAKPMVTMAVTQMTRLMMTTWWRDEDNDNCDNSDYGEAKQVAPNPAKPMVVMVMTMGMGKMTMAMVRQGRLPNVVQPMQSRRAKGAAVRILNIQYHPSHSRLYHSHLCLRHSCHSHFLSHMSLKCQNFSQSSRRPILNIQYHLCHSRLYHFHSRLCHSCHS